MATLKWIFNGIAKPLCIPGHVSQESLRIGGGPYLSHWRYCCFVFSGDFDYPKAKGQMCLEIEMP